MHRILLITLFIQLRGYASESEKSIFLHNERPHTLLFQERFPAARFDEHASEAEQAKVIYAGERLDLIMQLERYNHSKDSKIKPWSEKLSEISESMLKLVQLRKDYNLADPACACPECCSLTPTCYQTALFAGMSSWLSIPLCFIALSPVCAQPVEGVVLWSCLACEASGCVGLGVCWKCTDKVYSSCIMPCMLPEA